MRYIEIRYLHIYVYTFEVVGVGRFPGLRIYLHGLYRLLGVGCDVILSATLQRAPMLGHSCMYVKEGIAK